MVDPVSVVIEDDDDSTRVDPQTGALEMSTPDGGVVVNFGDHRQKKADEQSWYDNLIDKLDPNEASKIANELIDAIEADNRSREGYLAIKTRGLTLLGIKLEEPRSSLDSSSSVDGMSSVSNPLLLEGVLKGWANAQAELLPANGPAKMKAEDDTTQIDDELAEALERDFNHYLTEVATEYYPDTSHMLLWGVYFGGSGFKKVYRCPLRRRPVSESVDTKDLIVSDTEKDLRSCARITHQISMRPSVMKRMQRLGAYADVSLTQPLPVTNAVDAKIAGVQGTSPSKERPEDQPYTIWETQCELDLDEFAPAAFKGEGISLPYLVTVEKDSRKVLAIRRDWEEGDEDAERKRMYVRYPYVPGPGFYGTGLLHILGNASAAMTAAWREALDCAMFANFPGGMIAKMAGRQNSVNLRVGPGEFQPIDTNGTDIRAAILPNPYRDVTPGLMALMDKITQQARDVGGIADIPTAEGVQNTPVGTMLAQVEQSTKIMAAAHKGMHKAQTEEFELLLDLFRANPEDFARMNRRRPRDFWNEERLMQALNNHYLVPSSDPNVPSHMHRVMQAVALLTLSGDPKVGPYLDAKEVARRCLTAINEPLQGLLVDAPQTGPDPKVIEAQAKVAVATAKKDEAQFKSQLQPLEFQVKREEIQGKRDVANLNIVSEQIIHAADREKQQHAQEIERRDHALQTAKEVAAAAKTAREQSLGVAQFQHDRSMDHAAHGLAVSEHLQEREQSQREHTMALQEQDHEQSMAAHEADMAEQQQAHEREQAAHERSMDEKTHKLAVKESNKPKPKGKKK